jgi:hypothetical protein
MKKSHEIIETDQQYTSLEEIAIEKKRNKLETAIDGSFNKIKQEELNHDVTVFLDAQKTGNQKSYEAEETTIDVVDILESETSEASSLRLSNEFKINKELIQSQENDIETCFREVNYLRAEMAELCADETKYTLEKFYLARYANASMKELSAQSMYSSLTKKAALQRSKLRNQTGIDNGYERNWKQRIQNDIRVKEEYKVILSNTQLTYTIRKKYEWEYSRSKAILKADINAFKLAWPGGDYKGL